jgi:hypothetical protein
MAWDVTTAAALPPRSVCQSRIVTTSRNRPVGVAVLLGVVDDLLGSVVVVLLLFLVDPVADPKKENDHPTNDADEDDDAEEGVDHRDDLV